MSKEITLGSNRTGLKASPDDALRLLEVIDLQPEPPSPIDDADALRQAYRMESDSVGSMPPPTDLRGVTGSVGKALTGRRLHVFLDKLGERAAYERSGARLYDAALTRLVGATLPDGIDLTTLADIREDEHSHFLLLSEAIESLGGDPTCQTPCADFAGVQGMGLMQAINDPRATLPQVLQTLLAAEVIDVASWELLIELANSMGHAELGERFLVALSSENRHVNQVRTWLSLAMEQSTRLSGTE